MIKFFRRIRQQLLSEGRTAKYFKYAIGEVILVMIGILLALQVSNWNSLNAERKLEKRYVSELILDLETDSIVIAKTKAKSDLQALTKNKLLRYYEDEQIPIDSLIYYFGEQYRNVPKFTPISTTLDEMKSTGNIGVIQNTSLRRKVLETYNHYSTHINDSQDRYLIQQYALGNLIQETAPNVFNDIFKTSETLDIKKLLNNFEVKNRFMGNAVIGFNENITELQSQNNALLSDLRIESKKLD